MSHPVDARDTGPLGPGACSECMVLARDLRDVLHETNGLDRPQPNRYE